MVEAAVQAQPGSLHRHAEAAVEPVDAVPGRQTRCGHRAAERPRLGRRVVLGDAEARQPLRLADHRGPSRGSDGRLCVPDEGGRVDGRRRGRRRAGAERGQDEDRRGESAAATASNADVGACWRRAVVGAHVVPPALRVDIAAAPRAGASRSRQCTRAVHSSSLQDFFLQPSASVPTGGHGSVLRARGWTLGCRPVHRRRWTAALPARL